MQGLFYGKSCTVAIVVLFIGISIAPSISGSIGKLSIASRIEEVSDISFKLKKTHENDIASYDEPAVFGTRLFDTGNSFGRTIYVDDDAVPPYYGTEENPYKTIHDGINTSFDGDIIFVYNGIYYEDNLTINKSISLIGENKENTIIDGSCIEKEYSYIICILANRVNINGFTIQNCGEHIKGISADSQNNSVLNNIFKNNYIGIWIGDSTNNISGNNFVDNRICILSSYSFITISKNYFSNNSYGIDYCGGHDNNIFGNIFTKCFMGIYMSGGSSNGIISQNEFTKCNTGIFFMAASSNIISNNNLSSNCYGIKLDGSASKNNIFCDNLISDNSNYGIFIQVNRDRLNNIFYHNEFISNKQHAYEVLPNINIWGGNYWDGYTGVDNNYDGIGDKPYCIPPPENENKDWYPIISREYWPNIPPQPPIISGNQSGKPGGVYECEIEIFDLDDDQIYFLFDWGDGTNSGWVGPYKSGEIILLNHTWFNGGLYRLKAKAKDKFGIEGYWSEYFPVIVTKTRKLVFGNTLYVGGTGPGNYTRIQDAVDNASDWATLEVNMPKNVASPNLIVRLLQKLLDLFQILEPIIQPLLDQL